MIVARLGAWERRAARASVALAGAAHSVAGQGGGGLGLPGRGPARIQQAGGGHCGATAAVGCDGVAAGGVPGPAAVEPDPAAAGQPPLHQAQPVPGIPPDALERRGRKKRWLRHRSQRELARSAGTLVAFGDTFTFGSLKTTIYIVDGNGDTPYRRNNIEVFVSSDPVVFPGELQTFRRQVEARETERKRLGQQHLWNGANFAVCSFAVSRAGLTEESEVRLGLQPSDYYNFLAAKEALEVFIPKYGKTVREHYLDPFYWNRPVPFLSSSFGVNVALVTADNLLIVCKRSEVVGSRPLEYTVSANEGLSRGVDDAGGNPPDLYECGYRALREELGIERDETASLDILAFIIDLQLHQWGCLGMATLTKLTYPQLRDRYMRAPKDKFEHMALDAVIFEPKPVTRYILDPVRRGQWYGGAPACFYLALVAAHGRRAVERAITEAERRRRAFGGAG